MLIHIFDINLSVKRFKLEIPVDVENSTMEKSFF